MGMGIITKFMFSKSYRFTGEESGYSLRIREYYSLNNLGIIRGDGLYAVIAGKFVGRFDKYYIPIMGFIIGWYTGIALAVIRIQGAI